MEKNPNIFRVGIYGDGSEIRVENSNADAYGVVLITY